VRSGEVQVFNTNNEPVKQGPINFNFSGGTYKGTVELADLPEATYYVKARFDNTIFTQFPGVYAMKKGKNTLPRLQLVPGDLNKDNKLNMEDHSLFAGCFGAKSCTQKTLADFNDDGAVSGVDYNILIRSFAIRQGD
jgi:hypothetical protein